MAGTHSIRLMGVEGIIIVVILTDAAAATGFETGIGAEDAFDHGRSDSRIASAGVTGSYSGVADGSIGLS